jgi:hypothetical protein
MKKITCIAILFLQISILFSQNCKEIFSVDNIFSRLVFPEKENQFYGVGNSNFQALDYTTGNSLYRGVYKVNERHYPGVCKGNVVISDYKNSVISINLKSSETLWEINNFKNIQYVLVYDDYILVFDKEKPKFPIYCLDPVNGKILWQKDNLEKAITRDMIDYYGNDVFLIDAPSKKNRKSIHDLAVISSLTGETKFIFTVECKKSIFDVDYQITLLNNAFYVFRADSAGSVVTKVDLKKNRLAWTHRINLPYDEITIKKYSLFGGINTLANIDFNLINEKLFIKTNEGLEIVNDSTGLTVFYKHISLGKRSYLDNWMATCKKSLIEDQYAYMPYFVEERRLKPGTKRYENVHDYFLKKINYFDTSELWTADLGDRYYLRNLYYTDFGILVQFGGVTTSTNGLVPYPNYSFLLIDDKTGKIIWTIDEPTQSLYSVVFESKSNMYLFTNKLIRKIDISNGKELYNAPFNVLRYTIGKDKNYNDIVTSNDLDNFYIDINRKILIYFPSDIRKITGYRFD